jgi:hypothetical protein
VNRPCFPPKNPFAFPLLSLYSFPQSTILEETAFLPEKTKKTDTRRKTRKIYSEFWLPIAKNILESSAPGKHFKTPKGRP